MERNWGKEKLTIEQNLANIQSLELLERVKKVAMIGLQRLSVEPKFSPSAKVMMICGDIMEINNGAQNHQSSFLLFNCLDADFWKELGDDAWNEIGNIIYDLNRSVMLAQSETHSLLTFTEAKIQLEDCFKKIIAYEK